MIKYLFTRNNVLCYDKNDNRGSYMKNEENGILDARTLACYIEDYYKENFKKDVISPIKLQKSLYFCFAYWGGFARKSNMNKKMPKEIDLTNNEWLFDNKIEAWMYGPVVPDVYHESNLNKYKKENLFLNNEYVKEFVDNVLDDILSANDFKLVEISHEDKCWKKSFNRQNMFHNIEIQKEDIIREYAKNYQN